MVVESESPVLSVDEGSARTYGSCVQIECTTYGQATPSYTSISKVQFGVAFRISAHLPEYCIGMKCSCQPYLQEIKLFMGNGT